MSRFRYQLASFLLVLALMPVQAQWHTHEFNAMGTKASVELWTPDKTLGKMLSQQKLPSIMHDIEQEMSPYIDNSALSKLNKSASIKPYPVSKRLFNLLLSAGRMSKQTEGAFDITFASVGYLYDYRAKVQPDLNTVESLQTAINYQHVILNAKEHSVFFKDKRVKIDLGGIAKGFAVDQCIAALQKHGIKHAIVKAGGDSRIIGDRRGRPWIIGIKHPRDEQRIISKIPLIDTAISTSGDYERYFVDSQGSRIHHIIDPSTAKASNQSQSVTILANNSTYADALSTSVFVMGFKKGLALINTLPNVSAIIIDSNGQLHYSNDLLMSE